MQSDAENSPAAPPVLSLRNVSKLYRSTGVEVRAVHDVSLDIEAGDCLGLIGESGSGKSTLARLALRLQPCDSGSVSVDGTDLAGLRPKQLQERRSDMTIVFQDPLGSLNPRMRIRAIVGEPLRVHEPSLSDEDHRTRVDDALERVALDPSLGDRRPADLSGGQQQRASIARAIVTRPKLVVLDEPTSALDLSVQAQILDLLATLRAGLSLSLLFISHDIKCVSYLSDRVAVMYRGRLLEIGRTEQVLDNPVHPYTEALLGSALPLNPQEKPTPMPAVAWARVGDDSSRCPFHTRCPYRHDRVCDFDSGALFDCGDGHLAVASCGTARQVDRQELDA